MTYQSAESRPSRELSKEENAPSSGGGGWIGAALFIFSIALLAFIVGAYVVLAKVPPYRLLTNAHEAAIALYAKSTQYNNPYKTDLWYDARNDDKGVVTWRRDKALNGYTLYTSSHEPSAFLVDMNGEQVHRWHVPPENIWNKEGTAGSLGPFVYIRRSYMYPNGDLLAVYEGSGDTPWGLGLVKLDKDSNVLWTYLDERAHHDAEVGADGTVYALTHEMRQEPIEGQPGLETPLIEDFLVVLSPDGKVQKRISLLETIAKSRFKWLLTGLSGRIARDPLHTNSVKEVSAEAGAAMNVAREGDLMISFRNIKLVGVVDPAKEEIVWGTTGPWIGQHDAEPLANGNVLLFDNNGNFNGPGGSRVIEFHPETMEIVWQYQGTEDDPLKSVLRSEAVRLANGNTLITESEAGRLLEVTREGEVAWEYVNPVRGGEGNARIPIVAWGQRYTPDSIDSSFRPAPD